MPAVSDADFYSIQADDYDAVLVPGGWAPDKLRRYPEVLEIVRTFDAKEKPIG